MTLTIAHMQPIVPLLAGILILIMPRLLNCIVAIYLIISGALGLGLFHWLWCKRLELTCLNIGNVVCRYAARTAFQISGAVLPLTRSIPILNCPFLIRCISSTPAMTIDALRNRFIPSIGPK